MYGNEVVFIDYILWSRETKRYGIRRGRIASITTTPRSNLHKVLSLLFFKNQKYMDSPSESVNLDEKEKDIALAIMTNQKFYKAWKKAMKILKEKGEDEAKKWILEKVDYFLLKAWMEE